MLQIHLSEKKTILLPTAVLLIVDILRWLLSFQISTDIILSLGKAELVTTYVSITIAHAVIHIKRNEHVIDIQMLW